MTRELYIHDRTEPKQMECPFSGLSRLRSKGKVVRAQIDTGDTATLITDAGVIKELLSGELTTPDPRVRFCDELKEFIRGSEYDRMMEVSLFGTSGRQHTRLRQFTSAGFSPRVLRTAEPEMRSIVGGLLDSIDRTEIKEGRFDFLKHVATPLPAKIMSALLKLPEQHIPLFFEVSNCVMVTLSPAATAAKKEVIHRFNCLAPELRDILEARRSEPLPNDFLSTVFAAEAEFSPQSKHITSDEIFALVTFLLVAGVDTTVDLLSFAMYNLATNPGQRKTALKSRSNLSEAILESLRRDYFITAGIQRAASADFSSHGQQIRQGDSVYMMVDCALTDPDSVNDPERYDVGRESAEKLPFGYGKHYCVGASLAVQEACVAMDECFKRWPNLALVEEPEFDQTHPISRRMSQLLLAV